MSHLNKKLAIAAAATALMAAIGASVAQTADASVDPMATPQQQVDVNGNTGQQIYFFRDQGNSPETDPAAHLMLIHHHDMVPVAQTTSTTTTTTVAQADTAADATTSMPAAADTSNTDTSTTAAPVDNTPALAPKADRN